MYTVYTHNYGASMVHEQGTDRAGVVMIQTVITGDMLHSIQP